MTLKQKPLINYRQKMLLGLLSAFNGRLSRRDFQKYLFLFTQEFQKHPYFEFVPYKYGGFSFQSYADKRRLIDVGALMNKEEWELEKNFETLRLFNKTEFNIFHKRYSALKGEELVQDIYRRYPYYAINSEIASRLMNHEEMIAITAKRPSDASECFFTIGYEGLSFDGYLNRLIKNNIKTLVDVRCNPISRKYGFSKKTLADTTNKLGIEYIHLPELGIISEKRQELNTQADYNRLFDLYEQQELKQNEKALKQLFTIFLDKKRVAITCFEAQVCRCHRGRIAQALSQFPEWHYPISHL